MAKKLILEDQINNFKSFVEKKNAKAKKLGCQEISYTIGSPFITKVDDKEFSVVEVQISEDSIKMSGWNVIGSIQFVEGIPIIMSYKELPDWVRESKQTTCNHCNTNRVRNSLVVVENDSEIKVVGKTCLADFVGHTSAAQYADMMKWVFEGDEQFDEEFFDVGNAKPVYSVKTVLAIALFDIEKFGYVSKQASQERECMSTADGVKGLVIDCANEGLAEIIGADNVGRLMDKAETIVEFVKNIETSNDYTYNLKTIANAGYIPLRMVGFVASMVPFYNKETEPKVDTKASEWIGNVGDKKVSFNGKVTKAVSFSGTYGVSHMFVINCDGNIVMYRTANWFADQGEEVTFVATIKEHSDYNGVKQTVVTRAKKA
jgi:hypothetical protein